MNFEVSIEFVSYGLKSNTTALTFERTKTDFDTGDYDGSPTYYFEVNALNTDSSDKTVYLVDSGGSTIASLTVGSGGSSGDFERIRSSSFSPTSGAETYRIKLDGTTSADQLEVSEARLIVQQTNFTKTRVAVDLIATQVLSNNTDNGLSATNGGYASVPYSDATYARRSFFRYDTSFFSGTVTYEYEFLAKRTGTSDCYSSLYRVSNGNQVAASEVNVTNTSFTVYRTTISSDSEWVSGNDYQANIGSSHIFTTVRIAYAKVYITITNATKVRAYHQIGAGVLYGAGDGTGSSRENRRYLYDADSYANPTTYWELTAQDTFGDSSLKPTLDTYQTNDGPGTTGDTEVDDQTITTSMAQYINSESLTDGYRYGQGCKRPVGGSIRVFGVWLVVSEEEVQDAAQTRTAGDDLNNWAEAVRHDHPDQGTQQGDTLNNWQDSARHDFPEQESAYSDDLNNWSDSLDIVLGLLVQKSDDLDNWLDDEDHDLEVSGALTESKSDDLDNWADAQLLDYGLLPTDDLDNWDDSITADTHEKAYAFGDDLDNWLDAVNVGIPDIEYSFGDSLDNWQDNARHDFPYIYLQFGDSLNMQDGINKFGQPYPEDDLNYWQDNISILMPSNLRYQVFVDWENDGTFGTFVDNITSDVYEMTWSYGRDYASQLTGNSVAGQATILLRNTTGKYNKFKTTSPIYGNILPGRKIKILMHTSDTSTQMFGGFLDTIESFPSIHGAHTAKLTASGPISQINEKRINVAMQKNIYTGNAVAQVLDAAGWPGSERDIETGYIALTRWWTGGKILALTALRRLEDIEAGFFRETKEGKLAYEDKFHRLKIDNFVSKAAFRDVPGVSVVYATIHQEDPLKEIYNIVETEVRQYTLGDEGVVLWTLEDEPQIAAGETIEVWASCPSASTSSGAIAAEEWITPVRTTDFRAGSAPGASNGTNYISIAETKFDTGMKLLVTNTHGSETLYLSLLQARGTALYETYSTNIRAEDTDSQVRYGERTWPANDTYFSSRAEAEGYTQWILGAYNLPRPIINLEFSTYRNSELTEVARTLDISDMIDIEANATTKLGINYKFFIEKITHRVTDDGLDHRVLYECSAVVGAAFVERSVGDDLDNWNDHINVQLDDVIYTPVDKTVVIHEMFGQGHSSRSAAVGGAYQTNFATLTIDPSKFNGVVKAEWEIVGDNYDSSSKDIELYENGVSIKTLSIGAGQYYYRTSIEFTWPSTSKVYTIYIPETTNFEDVVVYRSRIKIYQESATKTQIQIMFQGDANYGWNYWGSPCSFQGGDYYPYAAWYSNETGWVNGDAVSELFKDAYCRWVYDASHWGTISNITLEAAMMVEPLGVSTTGHFRLYNEDTAQQVGAAISLANDASPNCPVYDEQTVSIDPDLLIDGDTYVIQGKIVSSGYVTSFRSCVYLELSEGLDAFETYYDMGRESARNDWEQLKHYFDFDDFGHVTYVTSWAEAATSTPKNIQVTDGSNTYGVLQFIDSSYAVKEEEFNHRQLSAGNHYTDSTGAQLRLRGHRVVVYQNVNELGLVDDLNTWNDGISKNL